MPNPTAINPLATIETGAKYLRSGTHDNRINGMRSRAIHTLKETGSAKC